MGESHSLIFLKKLNAFNLYEHSKVQDLNCLIFFLEQNGFLCMRDLKFPYCTIPLSKQSLKYVRCKQSGKLCKFLCLCFGLGRASKVFTKLLKNSIALLRRINIRIIVYQDDMLLMGQILQEIMIVRDTLIFPLQNLRFVINLKKSILQSVKQM